MFYGFGQGWASSRPPPLGPLVVLGAVPRARQRSLTCVCALPGGAWTRGQVDNDFLLTLLDVPEGEAAAAGAQRCLSTSYMECHYLSCPYASGQDGGALLRSAHHLPSCRNVTSQREASLLQTPRRPLVHKESNPNSSAGPSGSCGLCPCWSLGLDLFILSVCGP